MEAFELTELLQVHGETGRLYYEFLRSPSLTAGVYRLGAGEPDPQQPHGEDEVYYVVSGRARIRVADAERDVGPGSLIFVPATAPHRFENVAEDLTLLVFFAPPETLPAEVRAPLARHFRPEGR